MAYHKKPNWTRAILRTTTPSFSVDRDGAYEDYRNSEKDFKSFEAVQTSHSTAQFNSPHGYHNLKRSKSHEDKWENSKKDLTEDEILHWWELYRDRKMLTKWEERLKRLTEKLKKPGGEEILRLKIEKYLRKVPSYFSDYDEDCKDFRKALPDIIVRKLKKYYLGNDKKCQSNFDVLRVKEPKYQNEVNDNYKTIIKRWLKELTRNRTIVKDDIVAFIVHKIEPLILSKPDFDVEFRDILKTNLIDILNEIPIIIDNKDFLNKITDDLIEDLLKNYIRSISKNHVKTIGVNCTVDVQTLKPTEKDIIDFVIGHLAHFLQISQVCITARRKLHLERELVNILMNAINSTTLHINKNVISIVLQSIGELNEHQAEQYTNILIDDLYDSFWKMLKNHGNDNELRKYLTNTSYSHTSLMFSNTKQEPEEAKINKISCKNIDQSYHSKKFMCVEETARKPPPSHLGLSYICQNVEVIPGSLTQRNVSYVEELVGIVFDWYHELPYDLVGTVDASFHSHLIKELAERIYTRILSKENSNDVIDDEVDTWFKNFLQTSPDVTLVKDLKTKMKNVTFRKKLIDGEMLDKDLLKIYENSISDWLEKLNKDPAREDVFVKSKNMLVKELAVRLYEIKKTQGELSDDLVTKKMRRDVAEWLIKVPIHPKLNITHKRDVMAKMLMNMIKEYNLPLDRKEKSISQFDESLKECDVIDWLKMQPFYTKSDANDKLKQEAYTTELANVINEIKNGRNLNIDKELMKYIKKLDLKEEYDDNFIQETVADLKTFLQNIVIVSEEDEDKKLTEIIKQWLHSLPLNITSEREYNMVECCIKELLDIIKQANVNDPRSKDQLLQAIKKIIKVLPIECKTKCNETFLSHYSKSLLQYLNNTGKIVLLIGENIEEKNNEMNSPLRNPGDTEDLNINNYIRELTEQIEEWLTSLHLPVYKENGLRAVVIHELAKDIIDREKYLEINPSSRGTSIEEIDHLKFQIFKWINKLVGEENLETVVHAPELMQRIRSIRDPQKKIFGNIGIRTRQSLGAGPSSYHRNRPTNFDVGQMPVLGLPGPGGSMVEGVGNKLDYRRFSNPLGYPIDYIPNTCIGNGFNVPAAHIQKDHANLSNINQQENSNKAGPRIILRPVVHFQPQPAESSQPRSAEVPEGTTVQQIYDEYDEIFRQRSKEIPLEITTPEKETVANYIRQGIINIIWTTYFKLKSNPEIENDYKYVEMLMEEALDEIFNDLPTTAAIQKVKHIWKMNVLQDVTTMLRKVHNITDSPNFKLLLNSKKQRLIAKTVRQQTNKDILNYFVVTTSDMYLIQKKYDERDPIKATIYRLRLMKYIEHLVSRVDFYGITNEMLHNIRLKVLLELNNVPVPSTDVLPSELNEIDIGYVIENWFKELPGVIPQRDYVEQVWSRLRQLLASKINTLETRIYADEFELDRLIMHEASLFLETPGMLCGDNDLHINEMVEELANRLRTRRRDQALPEYNSFEQSRPLCSSIIENNPDVILLHPNSASSEQYPVLAHIPTISSYLSRLDKHLNSQGMQPNQPSIATSATQPPVVLQDNLIYPLNPTPPVFLNNVGQIVQPEMMTSIHEQMRANIEKNTPQSVQQEFIVDGTLLNRIPTGVTSHASHVQDSGSPRQDLKASLVNIQSPVQGKENPNLQHTLESQRPQIAFGSPRHGLSYIQVSNFAEQGFPAHNIPTQINTRHDDFESQEGYATTGFPVNQIPARTLYTESGTRRSARSGQELSPSLGPATAHGTRSTVRVGDDGNDIIEERDGRRVRCICPGRRGCRRRKYICCCDADDEEDVLFVPCRYYF